MRDQSATGSRRFVRMFQPRFAELAEINRLRLVLHAISDSRPDAHMEIEKNPELVNWICDTCYKASVGAYPPNAGSDAPGAVEKP